ncbi:virulence factor TspB C-terminal domain-related protein [Acinetobacter puyangensis]|uniref:virulence factor TspB C-terminal domain-related protein n=1 Tax=Acinetobacter puyangensis TaxID=1096779 RepID=UPI003A4E331E
MSSPDLETVLDYQKQCPAPIKIETEIIGYPFLYEFDFSLLCQYLNKLSIWLYAMSYFIGGLIIAGVRNA